MLWLRTGTCEALRVVAPPGTPQATVPGLPWGESCTNAAVFPFPPQYLELLRSHQSRPAKCLTIMWALGQAGFADLTEGLKGEAA